MPNLGAGVDQHVNPAVTPTWVFTPNSSAPNNVTLINEGLNMVFVGQSAVTAVNGFPVRPNSRPVELTGVVTTLYAISGVALGTAAGTASASAFTAGSTAITLTTAVPASLAAGTTIVVGNTAGTGWEAQVVNSTTSSSQITFANPLVNDHVGGSPVYLATAQYGQLRVRAGML